MRGIQGLDALSLPSMVSNGQIDYIAFPDALRGKYQCHTQADLTALRATGCDHRFVDVNTGVSRYVNWLASKD